MSRPTLVLVLSAALSLGSVPGAGWAQATPPGGTAVRPEIQRLVETMLMPEVAAVMRDEGLAHGETLEADMFPGRGGAAWAADVARIYDADRMLERFTARLDRELADDGAAVAEMQAFFSGDLGARILALELEARRALADEATEEAANIAVEDMIASQDPRMEVLRALAEASDLVEQNVTSALNANLAFYRGMAEGGGLGDALDEEAMLSDVWSQEPQVRAETERWLYSYMALAYAPLSDADLEAYRVFSEGRAGQVMTAAMFAAFDETFVQISRELGRAAARQIQGQEL